MLTAAAAAIFSLFNGLGGYILAAAAALVGLGAYGYSKKSAGRAEAEAAARDADLRQQVEHARQRKQIDEELRRLPDADLRDRVRARIVPRQPKP